MNTYIMIITITRRTNSMLACNSDSILNIHIRKQMVMNAYINDKNNNNEKEKQKNMLA